MATLTEEQRESIRLGSEAERILGERMVQGALAAMEQECFRDFQRAPLGDLQRLDEARRMLETVRKFRGLLTSFVTTGKLVAEEASRADAAEKESAPSLQGDSPNERRSYL